MPIVKNCHVYSAIRSVVVTVEGVDAYPTRELSLFLGRHDAS